MMNSTGYLPAQEERALEALLLDPDDDNKKLALQRLCDYRRAGYSLRRLHAFRTILSGLLSHSSARIVRWTFAALSRMGSVDQSEAISVALDRTRDHPLALSFGITALFSLCPADQAIEILRTRKIALDAPTVLASLQMSDALRDHLDEVEIDLDAANEHDVILAILLVGLERAPENLFSAKASNADVMGALNHHHHDLISQYSVWSLSENRTLGLENLGIRLSDTASRAPNVRSRIYTLVARHPDTPQTRQDFIEAASRDQDPEARRGLAQGLRSVFYPGLERQIFDWFGTETSPGNRQLLLEHMAGAADQCPAYREPLREAYSSAEAQSSARVRLEGAAIGTNTYKELRMLAFVREDLGGANDGVKGNVEIQVVVNQNVTGSNINIGAMTGVGSNVTGSANISGRDMGSPELVEALAEVVRTLNASPLAVEDVRQGQKLVEAAKVEPSSSTLGALASWLKGIAEGGSRAFDFASSFSELAVRISSLIP